MKRLTITLPDDLIEELDRVRMSCIIDTSRSERIQEALERMLRNCCWACGVPWANDWMTSTEVWEHYIRGPHRQQIICRSCWNKLVDARDHGRFEAKHGRAWLARPPTTTTNGQ